MGQIVAFKFYALFRDPGGRGYDNGGCFIFYLMAF